MPDDPSKRGRPDRDRVNVHEAHEVRSWTAHWGITEAQLREAVAAVGVMVKDVEEHLRKKGLLKK